ncbi:MAG: enoyl-CoA hydratase/isomerase family protein [Deltaproteobacteria bacterium]|nr:enoyl-CoA hydratase/isomerase family protein [Deltaproteobacteria bacterium]
MASELFQCTTEGGVALFAIAQSRLNVLPFAAYRSLCEAIVDLVESRRAKVVVLTGREKAFISGLDIKDLGSISGPEENTERTMAIKGLFRRIEALRRPVIAAVKGNCFGGGLELALSCHLRTASTGALLGLPEIRLGTIPSFGGTQRLARLVGTAKALELMLTGLPVTGEEAHRIGLVNHAWPEEELLPRTLSLASEIAAKSTRAVEAAVEAAVEGVRQTQARGEELESELSSTLIGTPGMREGVAAFLERRTPVFTDP